MPHTFSWCFPLWTLMRPLRLRDCGHAWCGLRQDSGRCSSQVAHSGDLLGLARGVRWQSSGAGPWVQLGTSRTSTCFESGVYFALPLGWAGLLLACGGVCTEAPHCGTGWAAPGPWGLSPPGTPPQEEGATLGRSSGLLLPLGGRNFEIKKK